MVRGAKRSSCSIIGGTVRTSIDRSTSMTDTTRNDHGHQWPRGIGAPAARALAQAGYTHIDQLHGVASTELLKLHGVGPKAIRVLREALAERGLAFADIAD
jgi:hypothetical protein